ncbi:MAG: FAD-dependent oxidoreductase, partial [Bacteroidetes Order II. Incertae sedis bacterium]|nr:FAD-dependent oxidoreductase [Bacteroidetes Order II. bacterium]
MSRYARQLERFPRMQSPKVAIIGAGVAGLAAARTLQDNGCAVTVFDRGRKPGGRLASIELSGHHVDLGAPVLSFKDPRLRLWVESWHKKGLIQDWVVSEADWSS